MKFKKFWNIPRVTIGGGCIFPALGGATAGCVLSRSWHKLNVFPLLPPAFGSDDKFFRALHRLYVFSGLAQVPRRCNRLYVFPRLFCKRFIYFPGQAWLHISASSFVCLILSFIFVLNSPIIFGHPLNSLWSIVSWTSLSAFSTISLFRKPKVYRSEPPSHL